MRGTASASSKLPGVHLMQSDVREGAVILALSALAAVVPAGLLGDPFAAIRFALTFTGLFVLPLTPWVLMLERSAFERFTLALVLGIAGIPIIFFIIGVLKGPLTMAVFLGVPLSAFITGVLWLRKKRATPQSGPAPSDPTGQKPG